MINDKKLYIIAIIGMFLMAIAFFYLAYMTKSYGDLLNANPCKLCEDAGNFCTRVFNP